ncbi:MAG TPA: hypothetical protein VJT15_01445 [Pyrinomonadaceae bacterium]|nr:hypothetical protein [Pyrinomonadaceae bacterium]
MATENGAVAEKPPSHAVTPAPSTEALDKAATAAGSRSGLTS